jgi:hypothetical protein
MRVRIESTRAVVGSALLAIPILCGLAILDYASDDPVIDLREISHQWRLLGGVFFVLSLYIVVWMMWKYFTSQGQDIRKLWLYVLALFAVLFVFCLVDSSGGLTRSPFVSFYAGILTVGILIAEKPAPIMFLGILIVACIAGNGLLQNASCSDWIRIHRFCVPKLEGGGLYIMKYGLAVVGTLAAMAYADYWKSKD